MKKILTILLLLPCFINAQSFDKLIDDKIQAAIKTIPVLKLDTIGVVKTVTASGTINIDTLTVGRNQGAWFELWVSSGIAYAQKICYVSNINGFNSISLSKDPYPFTGVTGGSFKAVLLNNVVVVTITGNSTIREWKYSRYNK